MPKRDLNKVALLCNFIEIALRHGFSPVNLLHIFRTPFLKNTSGWLLLPSLMTKLSISEFDSNMQCFRIQLDRIQLDIFWTSFKDQIIPSVKPDQQGWFLLPYLSCYTFKSTGFHKHFHTPTLRLLLSPKIFYKSKENYIFPRRKDWSFWDQILETADVLQTKLKIFIVSTLIPIFTKYFPLE